MKFDLQKYLAAPERFEIVNGYGSKYTYLTHSTEAESRGLIMLRTESKEVATFELTGQSFYLETSDLDLQMTEKPPEITFDGMAYMSEAGAVIGIKVDDHGPHILSPVQAHKCKVIIACEPEVVSTVDSF